MSFLLYVIGFVVFIAGLASFATMIGIPQTFVVGGALLLLAVAVVTGVMHIRAKDPPTA